MTGVRLATVEDVTAMSFIHAQTWKRAYTAYISEEYLNIITDDGWIPLFTRALTLNLHEAAVFELDGKITGTVSFGRGRQMTSCTIGDMGNANKTISCTKEYIKELKGNDCCTSKNMNKLETPNCNEDCIESEIISLYVLPEYWSTKQGYQLIKFAIDRLKIQGYKSCYLWVIKENTRAVNFYKKFGFTSTHELTTVMLANQAVIEEKYRLLLCDW